ncbi:uncharacterized protein LOC142328120 [Lycorma delicatula]|uniref:uncharacterized protein LOC142328120 n=1 Tax=Lycorma delicatula TaxID=130591 RepID=UPI003F51124D
MLILQLFGSDGVSTTHQFKHVQWRVLKLVEEEVLPITNVFQKLIMEHCFVGDGTLLDHKQYLVFFILYRLENQIHHITVHQITTASHGFLFVELLALRITTSVFCEVWQGKGKAGHLVTNLTSHGMPDFHLKDLEPGTSYSVSIYSSNGKGRSSDSIMLSVSTLGHTHHENRRTSGSSDGAKAVTKERKFPKKNGILEKLKDHFIPRARWTHGFCHRHSCHKNICLKISNKFFVKL